MSVARYKIKTVGSLHADPEGQHVAYSNYAALEAVAWKVREVATCHHTGEHAPHCAAYRSDACGPCRFAREFDAVVGERDAP